jgi:hypothetical protein
MKLSAKKLKALKIQKAIYGYVIPMMKLPAIYKALEAAVEAGKEGAELAAVVAAFPGVEEA